MVVIRNLVQSLTANNDRASATGLYSSTILMSSTQHQQSDQWSVEQRPMIRNEMPPTLPTTPPPTPNHFTSPDHWSADKMDLYSPEPKDKNLDQIDRKSPCQLKRNRRNGYFPYQQQQQHSGSRDSIIVASCNGAGRHNSLPPPAIYPLQRSYSCTGYLRSSSYNSGNGSSRFDLVNSNGSQSYQWQQQGRQHKRAPFHFMDRKLLADVTAEKKIEDDSGGGGGGGNSSGSSIEANHSSHCGVAISGITPADSSSSGGGGNGMKQSMAGRKNDTSGITNASVVTEASTTLLSSSSSKTPSQSSSLLKKNILYDDKSIHSGSSSSSSSSSSDAADSTVAVSYSRFPTTSTAFTSTASSLFARHPPQQEQQHLRAEYENSVLNSSLTNASGSTSGNRSSINSGAHHHHHNNRRQQMAAVASTSIVNNNNYTNHQSPNTPTATTVTTANTGSGTTPTISAMTIGANGLAASTVNCVPLVSLVRGKTLLDVPVCALVSVSNPPTLG